MSIVRLSELCIRNIEIRTQRRKDLLVKQVAGMFASTFEAQHRGSLKAALSVWTTLSFIMDLNVLVSLHKHVHCSHVVRWTMHGLAIVGARAACLPVAHMVANLPTHY